MIVVDTNIIAGLYTDSAQRDVVVSVYQRDPAWGAPYLWRSELRNVMALYMRQKLLDLSQCTQIVHWAEDLMVSNEYRPVTQRVLALASESGCTAYDCEFVSVAEDLGCQLVTFDKKVLKQFPDIAISPEGFVAQ